MSNLIKPIILCGGSGTRLWPLSRKSLPKQFVPLIGDKSLLEGTIERVQSFESPIFITSEEHRFLVADLLKITQGNKKNTILLEPAEKNTAAAMAITSLLPDIHPEDLLLFLPSDHFIPDTSAFISTIYSGVKVAQAGYIVTFGVQPTFPSSAYGYIQKGASIDKDNFYVENFVEKPGVESAHEMLNSGNYLWNAGIFLCRAGVLLEALKQHAPDILELCTQAMNQARIDGRFLRPDSEPFLACRSESIDYAVMEHFDKVAVVPFVGAWSDVGSWSAVAVFSESDSDGNRVVGQGLMHASKNTYINAPHRPVVALGTSDLVIVDTPDALLVAHVNKLEDVKQVVTEMRERGYGQAISHRRVYRPWGWYDLVDGGDQFQVKRITVRPGASLSLQMHNHRAEHWIVVKGRAKVTNGDDIFFMEENQSTYIPIGSKHRLENHEAIDLEMIEVQSGQYLGEDDIVRFEDAYGRS